MDIENNSKMCLIWCSEGDHSPVPTEVEGTGPLL